MKKRNKIILAVIGIALAGVGVKCTSLANADKGDKVRTAVATTKELELSIISTGSIQPVTMVEVGTQVSGIVEKIYVDFNSEVKKGQLLASLDKLTLNERVKQSKASLENAKSNAVFAQQSYERTKRLYDQNASTPAKLEEAVSNLASANSSVISAEADYNQSLVNLSYADIYSPISGRILNRAVDAGQTVAASFSTPTLFTIANDLTKMQVEVDVDEADIGLVKVGQKAKFSVDTYPGEEFDGTVAQVRLEPEESSNVVTYTVIVDAPNPQEKLFPGMTANITITTQSPKGVCVPAEALYFSPDSESLTSYIIEDNAKTDNKIWTLEGQRIISNDVLVGASDGIETIIISGIEQGDSLVSGIMPKESKEKEGTGLFSPPSESNRPPRGAM